MRTKTLAMALIMDYTEYGEHPSIVLDIASVFISRLGTSGAQLGTASGGSDRRPDASKPTTNGRAPQPSCYHPWYNLELDKIGDRLPRPGSSISVSVKINVRSIAHLLGSLGPTGIPYLSKLYTTTS